VTNEITERHWLTSFHRSN